MDTRLEKPIPWKISRAKKLVHFKEVVDILRGLKIGRKWAKLTNTYTNLIKPNQEVPRIKRKWLKYEPLVWKKL